MVDDTTSTTYCGFEVVISLPEVVLRRHRASACRGLDLQPLICKSKALPLDYRATDMIVCAGEGG